MTMIDLRYVKKLVEMLDESSVDSIEISSDKGMKIRISKTPQQRGAVQMTAPMTMPARQRAANSRVSATFRAGSAAARIAAAPLVRVSAETVRAPSPPSAPRRHARSP